MNNINDYKESLIYKIKSIDEKKILKIKKK